MSESVVYPTLAVSEALVVLFSLLVSESIVLCAWEYMRGEAHRSAVAIAYRGLLAASFFVMTAACVAAAYGDPRLSLEFGSMRVSLSGLMWVNVSTIITGAVAMVRDRRLDRLPDVVLLAVGLHPVAVALGVAWPMALVALASYFSARMSYLVCRFAATRHQETTRISPIQALEVIGEGVLCVASDGRILFLNDAMRRCLSSLGLPTDVADHREVWDEIARAAEASGQAIEVTEHGMAVRLSPDETRYFAREPMAVKGGATCVMAYDITEQDHLAGEMRAVNDDLELTGLELKESLARVQEVAENDTRRRMRFRVHDVVGQRVSIIHRFLEDGDTSDEAVERIMGMLSSVLTDLRSNDDSDPETSLRAIVGAFELVGVTYHITGSLPADGTVAGFFVRVIREASTNAVRHGQARSIEVSIDQTPTEARLVVSNDGQVPDAVIEHVGIQGMRRRARELGATLRVEPSPRFTIRANVPLTW